MNKLKNLPSIDWISGKIGGVTGTSSSGVVVGGVLTPGDLQIHAHVRIKTSFLMYFY